jgi:hypothetical protein
MINNRMILGILLFTVFGLMSAGSANNNLANAGEDKRSYGDHDDKRSYGDHDDKRSYGDHDDKRSYGDGNCYKKGVSDGKDNPFNSRTFEKCGHDYYKGFIKGCTSVEGNTKDVCESATDT